MKRIFQRRSWWFCFDSDIVKIRFQIFLKRREFSNRIALWSKIFSSVRGICESNKGGDLFRGVRKSNETFQRINRGRRRFELFPRTRLIALRDTARYLFGVSWWPPRYLSSRADLRVGVMCFVERGTKGQSNRWRPFEIWFATAVHIRPRIVALELLHFMSAVILNIRRTRVHPTIPRWKWQ